MLQLITYPLSSIGPTDLTVGTILLNTDTPIPTVTDNAFEDGSISTKEVGVFFAPAPESISGELTFGGLDSSKYTGDINYVSVPLTYVRVGKP